MAVAPARAVIAATNIGTCTTSGSGANCTITVTAPAGSLIFVIATEYRSGLPNFGTVSDSINGSYTASATQQNDGNSSSFGTGGYFYFTKKEMQEDYDRQMIHHCPDCGAKMILRKFISMYSPDNGEPYYQLEGKCPNARWWKGGAYHATRIYNMPVVAKLKRGTFGTPIPRA